MRRRAADASTPIDTLYIYDITTNTWSTGAALPAARYSFAGVARYGLYYVIGGYTTTYEFSMLAYDPDTNSWSSALAPMIAARRSFAASVIGGKIYVAGGYINPAWPHGFS